MSENFSNIITQAVRPQKQNSRSKIIFNKQESYKKMCEQQKKSNSFFARLFPFLCCFVTPNFDVDNNPKIQNSELPSTSTAEKYHKVEKPLKTVCPIYKRKKKQKKYNKYLLGPQDPKFKNKKTLVLDLDETLIHSSFKPVDNPDFIVKVEIDNVIHDVYVLKRPGVDEFLRRMGELYEVVIFTASLSKYADAVIDTLDKHLVVSSRLFRESFSYFEGNYLKDLSKIGRNLNQVIIVDNSPMSYSRQPYNAIPVRTWFDDPTDNHLEEILPWLEKAAFADDLYSVLEDCREAMGYGV